MCPLAHAACLPQVDGQDMRLCITAAKRLGSSGQTGGGSILYLIVRILAPPVGGRPDLLEHLQNPSRTSVAVRRPEQTLCHMAMPSAM